MLRRQALARLSLCVPAILSASRVRAQKAATAGKVAVILPPAAGSFRRATQAVLAGLRAAQTHEGASLALDLFPVDERFDALANAFADIDKKGYDLVIGPLPRGNVDQLSELSQLGVPTLALNGPENERLAPSNVTYFGLPIESDAQFIARIAFALHAPAVQGRPLRAAVVHNAAPLPRRAAAAFAEAWKALGGQLGEVIETESRLGGELKDLLAGGEPDLSFVASSLETARAVRTGLPREAPLYGPSLLSTGITASNLAQSAGMRTPELDGYRVCDLPWLLQGEQPAVMAHARQPALSHQELQRLYALGIDAYRIAREMLNGRNRFELDGVTGRLRLDRSLGAQVQRQPTLAEYRAGVLVPLETP